MPDNPLTWNQSKTSPSDTTREGVWYSIELCQRRCWLVCASTSLTRLKTQDFRKVNSCRLSKMSAKDDGERKPRRRYWLRRESNYSATPFNITINQDNCFSALTDSRDLWISLTHVRVHFKSRQWCTIRGLYRALKDSVCSENIWDNSVFDSNFEQGSTKNRYTYPRDLGTQSIIQSTFTLLPQHHWTVISRCQEGSTR